ncbi:MAG: hypothetical protein CMP10_15230 [Zetaproteobacteria bacterium]|nr:hypothetical protein [Pseudobdellovibrionaceae bacterium]|tara:strand:- start:47 stop:703 length:657 start_codon:yes stop_codon:yes gene_type:complete
MSDESIALEKLHVFLIDDDKDLNEYLESMMEEEFRVTPFLDGQTAFNQLNIGDVPDIIVSDFKMPGLSGIDFVDQVRSIDLGIPVILVTGAADKDMAIKALSLGVFAILEKPIEGEELLQMMRRALSRSRAMQLSETLLQEFGNFTTQMQNLVGAYELRFIEAENKLFKHGLNPQLDKKAIEYIKVAKENRILEKTIRTTKKLIDEMTKEYENLKKIS